MPTSTCTRDPDAITSTLRPRPKSPLIKARSPPYYDTHKTIRHRKGGTIELTLGGAQAMNDPSSAEQVAVRATGPATVPVRHTRWLLLVLYALAFAWGVRNIRAEQDSNMDLLLPVGLAIALGWWALVDARLRAQPIPYLARQWFFVFAGLVVPCYVVWSRRLRGLGWIALHAALWLAVATSIMLVGRAVFPAHR